MIRTAVRPLGAIALVALLVVGATACSGSDEGSSPGVTDTTVEPATASTNPALGDLSDLDGAARGLSGDDLDCYNVQLAFVALEALPLGILDGSGQDELDQLQRDVQTLQAQVPAAVAAEFETYAQGVQAYAQALKGIDLANLSDPATQARVSAASEELDSSEMSAAADGIEAFVATTCPAPASTTTTAP